MVLSIILAMKLQHIVALAAASSLAHAARQPNFLFMLTDDQDLCVLNQSFLHRSQWFSLTASSATFMSLKAQ